MKWLLDLIKPKKVVFQVPIVQKPPKDISEPIISFIECVKENPRRFKLKQTFSFGLNDYKTTYYVKDKVTGIVYKVVWNGGGNQSFPISCSVYLTEDEKEVLWYLFQDYFYNQASIKGELVKKRKMRKRDQLKSIYCKNMEEV
jgi:hypothetical protein